jgi:hypothetical protein
VPDKAADPELPGSAYRIVSTSVEFGPAWKLTKIIPVIDNTARQQERRTRDAEYRELVTYGEIDRASRARTCCSRRAKTAARWRRGHDGAHRYTTCTGAKPAVSATSCKNALHVIRARISRG